MGQGYSLTTLSAASASIDVPELADLVAEKTLSSARFMKSIRARNQRGFVFVKAVMKPYSSFQVQKYVKQITDERNALMSVPNALGYKRIIEVGSGGFLVRQFIYSSVYDRMSTRPFLEDIEKKWLTFQLLCAVRDCHAQSIYHGDIKTENLLVTSWNWLYLTDFSASFKPVTLPEDNPADFSFYFDTSGRRTCYLAPERFTNSVTTEVQDSINWSMDIFSVGCVIAEMFLEGPIFSLSQIFKYRAGDYSPEHTHLNKIDDLDVREMIMSMIDLEPEKRYSAEQYLSIYRSKIFPEYFDSFLHQYMRDLTDPSAGQKPINFDIGNLGDSDDKIERVYNDLDKISYFLGYNKEVMASPTKATLGKIKRGSASRISKKSSSDTSLYDGSLLFLGIIVASARNTAKASARLKACDLMVAFAERLPDEAKLDRVLPYVMNLLNDHSDAVKIAALRSVTSILDMIDVVSPINAYIFPEYIFPNLRQFILGPSSNPSTLVRATYASCLASLARSSARILDTIQAIRADGRLTALAENEWSTEATYHGLYDVARAELTPHFEEATTALITDPDVSVRRAFLGSVSVLCVFFGSSKTSDLILSHLNTYLNENDWILKCSFLDAMVGVAAYIGSASLEKFILPIMLRSLTDVEDFVVEKVFRSFARMASLGLLQKSTTWELISIASRFFIHPGPWIRESAIHFTIASTKYISLADKFCIVMPMIQPFLKTQIAELSESSVLDSLKKPLSKVILDLAIVEALKHQNSAFWTAASNDNVFILQETGLSSSATSLTKRPHIRIPPSQRKDTDHKMLERLHQAGFSGEDELKLMALREYVFRIAGNKVEQKAGGIQQLLSDIVPLNKIEVTPQTVLFDNREPIRKPRRRPTPTPRGDQLNEPHTLADALLDASTTIEPLAADPVSIASRNRDRSNERAHSASRLNTQDSSLSSTLPGSLPSTMGPPKIISSRDNSRLRRTSSSEMSSLHDGDKPSFRKNSSLTLRHQSSAINLMKRQDTAKAEAAISTSSENALGRIDMSTEIRRPSGLNSQSLSKELNGNSRSPSPYPGIEYEPNHSYAGTDRNVLRLLDNHFVENFPVDLLELGQIRHPIDLKIPIRRSTDHALPSTDVALPQAVLFRDEPWRPQGNLIAMFSEHTAAVNRVVASPDHTFFVTASDDGTCRIWDTTRLEKNVTPRSRQTHRHTKGAKVKSLCFVENTHAFVSAADDGNVHVVKVDYRSIDGGESSRYGKLELVRDYQLKSRANTVEDKQVGRKETEYGVWLHHYRSSTSQSVLLIATTQSRIIALDLKTMSLIYDLQNPLHHGTPTTLHIDPKQQAWLIVATSHGILDLWDLRFRIRLRSFGINSTGARVERVLGHPARGGSKRVLISSGGEITHWDIEKMICKEVFRPSSTPSLPHSALSKQKAYEAWYPDEESTETVLARFAKITSSETEADISSFAVNPNAVSPPTSPLPLQPSIPALAIAIDLLAPSKSKAALPGGSSSTPEPTKAPLLATGGSDRSLRYWDLTRPESSFIISGPNLSIDDATGGLGPPKAKYDISHPLSVDSGGQIMLVSEILPPTTTTGIGSAKSTPSKKAAGQRKVDSGGKGDSAANSPSKSSGGGSKLPRNTIISRAQQELLKTHLDSITDVIILRKPYGMLVSVDRSGGVVVMG